MEYLALMFKTDLKLLLFQLVGLVSSSLEYFSLKFSIIMKKEGIQLTIDDEIQKWEIELKKGFSKPLILLSLAEKPTYPYQLTKTIITKTQGKIAIAGSNIYPILKRMEDDGLIEGLKDEDSMRKMYSLTNNGKRFLSLFSKNINEFLIIIQSNLQEIEKME